MNSHIYDYMYKTVYPIMADLYDSHSLPQVVVQTPYLGHTVQHIWAVLLLEFSPGWMDQSSRGGDGWWW